MGWLAEVADEDTHDFSKWAEGRKGQPVSTRGERG